MKLSSRKLDRGCKIELCMTSMIDVIFLLLIFFMLNTGYHLTERNLDSGIQVQSKSSGRSRSDFAPVIVEIVNAGDRAVFKLGTRQIATGAELTGVLRQFPNKGDGAFVRVSDDAPFAMAAAAIQACHDAGFVSVSYVAVSGAN